MASWPGGVLWFCFLEANAVVRASFCNVAPVIASASEHVWMQTTVCVLVFFSVFIDEISYVVFFVIVFLVVC